MSYKIKILRILSNGILTAKNEDDKKGIRIFNAISYTLFILTSFFSTVQFYYGLYCQVIIAYIIQAVITVNFYLIKKGFLLLSKFLGIQCVIIFVFLSNLYYPQSKSLIYLYLIVIPNMPLIFRVKDLKYTVFFILESIALFFLQIFFYDLFPDVAIKNENIKIHDSLSTIILLVYFTILLFFHVIIIQYYESRLKTNRDNLIRIQRKLKSQNEDLQRFGLAVTHSLKTPLILTNGFLNRIRNNIAHDTGHDLNPHYFRIIKESNNLIEKYSEDLSAYNSVINIHNQSLSFDASNVIDEQIKILAVRFENAEIINDVKKVTIKKSLLHFEIIIQVLIENAIIYNESDVPTLLIYSTKDNNKINIFFKDNGIGINKEFKDNIFLPFVRINKKENVQGSGLGLTSAKIACDKIGAQISLLESSKKGSIFKLELE